MGHLEKGRSDKWRWILLPSAFLNMLLHTAISYNCGVLYNAVLDTYDTDAVQSAWLMSYYCSMFAIAAPIASAAVLLANCRTVVTLSGVLGLAGFALSSLVKSLPVLYITLGLTGLAQSLCQAGSVLSLSYYFPDNLPLVHGVCLAGTGMGSFFHPVLTQTFLDAYGFDGTMLILGGIVFHSSYLGMLLRPNSLEIESKYFLTRHAESKWKIFCSKIIPPSDIFKIPAFVVLIPTVFFYSAAFQGMVVILPSYIKRYVGLSAQEGSVAAMLLGGGSAASRLTAGIAASDENIGEAILMIGMAGLLSVISFCGNFIMDLQNGTYIFSFFFGFYAGAHMSLGNSLLIDIVGIEMSAHAYGMIMSVYGIAGFAVPPIIFLFVEIQGPDMLFITCGVICLLVFSLALLMNYLRKFSNGKTI